jgi:hypothetical protein
VRPPLEPARLASLRELVRLGSDEVKKMAAPVLRHLHAGSKVDLMGWQVGVAPCKEGECVSEWMSR